MTAHSATLIADARITDPTALLVAFVGFVAGIFWLSRLPVLTRLFRYLPPIVWIYFLPVVATTLEWTPKESPFYDWCSELLLPFALLLLTLSTDVKAIVRLGPTALGMLLAGTCGIVLGAPIALALFQGGSDPHTWMGLGALAGSWIGGLSNMAAVKESINCPDEILSPMIIIDSVVGYGWMMVVIALSRFQNDFDRVNRARRDVLDDLNQRLAAYRAERSRPITLASLSMILGVGFVGGWLCMRAGDWFPVIGSIVSHTTWGVLLVMVVGLALSFTPARKLDDEGASTIGYIALYLLVATMGAGGDLRAVAEVPSLFALGAVWIGIHAACLLVAARLLRAPAFLVACGSQGNIGGVVSTPIVATIYQPALAPVGLLMGVVGNLIGTPAALAAAQLMAQVAYAYHGDAALPPAPTP